jgi:hypothetical protein
VAGRLEMEGCAALSNCGRNRRIRYSVAYEYNVPVVCLLVQCAVVVSGVDQKSGVEVEIQWAALPQLA